MRALDFAAVAAAAVEAAAAAAAAAAGDSAEDGGPVAALMRSLEAEVVSGEDPLRGDPRRGLSNPSEDQSWS